MVKYLLTIGEVGIMLYTNGATKKLTALPPRRTGQLSRTNGPGPLAFGTLAPRSSPGQEDGSIHMTAIVFPQPALPMTDGAKPTYEIRRRGRFWEVLDSMGELICMTVYKRGAKEVVRRLRGE